ncbi:MAG: HAD hydrolase-like protein, partial [Brevundimonas sp.]|uniref:HAD hydrolase-like protein n=1 Tax=Brevundimonas sp. TaxID=1871086 RepID=UPI0039189F59
ARDPAWHHPDHPDRKPNPGMILRAAAEHDIALSRSFLIGDRQGDLEAARRAGIPGFLVDGQNLDACAQELLGG